MISPGLYRTEMVRQLRNPYTLAFSILLPTFLTIMFGSMMVDSADPRSGTVAMYLTVTMATFGVATAMTSVTSLAAIEVQQGWGRQLGLTPMTTATYALTKLLAAWTVGVLTLIAVYAAGLIVGAEPATPSIWFTTALIVLGGGAMWALYGIGIGLNFPADSAVALASISITFYAFLAGLFIPTSGLMHDIGRFTPMYGYATLAQWPVVEGAIATGGSEHMWVAILNVAVWTAVFIALTITGVSRSRRRR